MFKWIKQRLCKHNYKSIWGSQKHIGQTVNWAFSLTKEYEEERECLKCGKVIKAKFIYWSSYIPSEFRIKG